MNERASDLRCLARRVHPYSADFFVRCEREWQHGGKHVNDGVEWADLSPYSLPDLPPSAFRVSS